MKISIIVPVYNSSKYLERCIDSLINQTYKNTELIFINDGSTDKSLQILKKYKDKIIIINQKNKGTNLARKQGVLRASGDYVMFVDSDDYLDINAVKILVKYLEKKNCDVIKFNGIIEPTKELKNSYVIDKNKVLNKNQIYDLLINTKILNNLCFSIYKRDLIKKVKAFNESISNCEDYLVNLEFYTSVDKLYMVKDVLYHYQMNIKSTTKNKSIKRIYKYFNEQLFVYSKLYDYLKKWNINTYENRLKVTATILDSTKSSIYNLVRYDKKGIYLNNILNSEILNYIRSNYNYKTIKKYLNKNLSYRIKHYPMIKSIYFKNSRIITLYKYLLKG